MHRGTALRGLAAAIITTAIVVLSGIGVAQARTTHKRVGQARLAHANAMLKSMSAGGEVQADNTWNAPIGAHAADPVGYVMVIHGGGWMATGQSATDGTLPDVTNLREAGWGAYNVDYRAGEASFSDVVAAYAHMRSVLGPQATICVFGESAGAHLALLLAARKHSITCVIAEAAPIDLASLPTQPGWAPSGTSPEAGPEWTYNNLIVPTFGSDAAGLSQWSPVTYAQDITAHMLLGGSTYDWVIPDADQMAEMQAAAAPGTVATMQLAGESTPSGQAPNFPHASITPDAQARWSAAELRMLDWALAN